MSQSNAGNQGEPSGANAVLHVSADGRVLRAGGAASRWLGYTAAELAGLTLAELCVDADASAWREHWGALEELESVACERTLRRKDGTAMALELTCTLMRGGGEAFAVLVGREAEEHARTREQLQHLANRLHEAQQIARLGYWERDLPSGVLTMSDNMYEIYGFARGPTPPTLEEVMHRLSPDGRAEYEQRVARAIETGEDGLDLRAQIVRADGEPRDLYVRVKVVRDGSGRATRLVGVTQDVTERRLVQRELEAAARRLNEAQEIAHIGSWERDLATQRVAWSAQLYRLYGYEPGEIEASYAWFIDRVHPDDRARLEAGVEQAMRERQGFETEFRIIRRDGQTRIMHSRGRVATDTSGRPTLLYGTLQDVTESHRVNRELRATADRLSAAQRVAHVGSWDRDLTSDEEFWSDEMYRIFGCEPDMAPVPFDFFLRHVHPEDRGRVEHELREAIEGGEQYSSEYRIVLTDGRVRECHSRGRVERDESGRAARMYGTCQDVTERKQSELALRRSEEHYRRAAETNRRLLAEVNHRVRNNLTGLLSLLRITREETRDVEEFCALMRQRITAMTKAHNLLAGAQWHSLDLHTLIRAVAAGYCGSDEPQPRIALDGPDTWISPRQVVPLALALNEMFINAAKHGCYSTPRGRLRIAWHHDARLITIRWREADGPPIAAQVTPSLGTELITGFICFELNGQIDLTYPRDGASHTLRVPLERAELPALGDVS